MIVLFLKLPETGENFKYATKSQGLQNEKKKNKKKYPKLMRAHLETNEHEEQQNVASQERPVDTGEECGDLVRDGLLFIFA